MAIGPDRPETRRCRAEELHWIVAMPQTDAGTKMKFLFPRQTHTLLVLWPRAEIKSENDELNAPKFSTAIGWKIRLVGKLLYFINFRLLLLLLFILFLSPLVVQIPAVKNDKKEAGKSSWNG